MRGAGADPSAGVLVQTKDVARGILSIIGICSFGAAFVDMVPLDMSLWTAFRSILLVLLEAVVVYAALVSMLTGVGDTEDRSLLDHMRSGPAPLFVAAWAFPHIIFNLATAILTAAIGDTALLPLILLVATGFLFLHILAKYGTFYPALIDGGDLSLHAAIRRAQVERVFWRLVGVFLFGMGMIFVLVLVFPLILLSFGWVDADATTVEVMNSFSMSFLVSLIFSCSSVATVVILCNAYRGVYADPSS